MNYRKLFLIAAVVNLALAALLVSLWLRSKHNETGQQQTAARTESPALSSTESTPPGAPQSGAPQPESKSAAMPLTPVQLSPERMQSIGVTFGTVAMREIGGEIRATGNVEVDERRIAYVQTRFAGWLRNVYASATYQFVRKGQPLFTIYSPDLVTTQQEFLLALRNRGQLQTSSVEGVSQGASSLVSAARDRLRQWEVPESEIAKIERTGKPITELTINSPVSGYVTERNALPNMYVQPETKLFTVADLSSVWVNAQVFQNDIGKVKPGDPAEVTVDAYAGKRFRGRVEQVLPQVDMNTRTVRVRIALGNPGLLLKPGMFVNVVLKAPMGKALLAPASAVLQSGSRQVVFIDRGSGMLEPREVQLGERTGDFYIVRTGAKAGDRVVTSATFLIDSESQLQAAAVAFTPPPPEAGGAAAMNPIPSGAQGQLTTDPSPPRKGGNVIRIKLTAPDGKPITGAQVTVTFFMPAMAAMGMTEMKAVSTLADQGSGMYEGRAELDSGGTWQVTIVARQNGQVLLTRQSTISATGGM